MVDICLPFNVINLSIFVQDSQISFFSFQTTLTFSPTVWYAQEDARNHMLGDSVLAVV
jgi:hypothetical protein